jgi:hypothetical protein
LSVQTEVIPSNIKRKHIIKALKRIDKDGLPNDGQSSTYDVIFDDKRYPPKLVVSYANSFVNGQDLDRAKFNGGKDTECFNLLAKEGFVVVVKDYDSVNSPVWLLTWNPKLFKEGGFGNDVSKLELGAIEESWRCSSGKPQVGDTVYLLRLGVDPKGIVVKGRVSAPPFIDKAWRDGRDGKDHKYIKFGFDSIKETPESGMLEQNFLKVELPKQEWSPQSSGISLKQEYKNKINELWHSKERFMDYFTQEEFDVLKLSAGLRWDKTDSQKIQYQVILKNAYAKTEYWMNSVADQVFGQRFTNIRKNPINQGQRFESYNWGRIYPTNEDRELKALAYTVGIDSEGGFVIKIDTVGKV